MVEVKFGDDPLIQEALQFLKKGNFINVIMEKKSKNLISNFYYFSRHWNSRFPLAETV